MNTNTMSGIFRRFLPICLSFLFIYAGLVPPAYAAPPTERDYRVKAKYLYSFSKFVAWPRPDKPRPNKAFVRSDTRLRLCVLGENPFGLALDLIVGRHNKHDRQKYRLEVQYIKTVAQSTGCHVLYISDSEKHYWAAILAHVEFQPVLTVSDMPSFVTGGGMIQLYRRRNEIRFIIDPQTIRDAGLEPHVNLLHISTASW